MCSIQHMEDLEATSGDDGGGRRQGDDQLQEGPHGMSLISNQINMTNCYNYCKRFFKRFESIHFKVLIAYWMMAGYLGVHVHSVEAAYQIGFGILFNLIHKEKILKLSDNDPGMVEFAGSSPNCRHPGGFCFLVDRDVVGIGFDAVLWMELAKIGKVVLSKDGILSMDRKASKLQGFDLRLEDDCKYTSIFNPMTDSLKLLLANVKNPSVLLLRGFDDLSLPSDSESRLNTITILEISGSTRLTTIPVNIISQMSRLRCLILSDLPIEVLPNSIFSTFSLRWLILRGCSKLRSLNLKFFAVELDVLDLSHCTALQWLDGVSWYPYLTVLDLSYTPLDPKPFISSPSHLSHLYLRGSKLEDFSFLLQLDSIQVLDLSGCCCFTSLDEGLVNNMSKLQKLDLSWTKVNQLPSLANLSVLHVLSLRGLELDSLETLASLSDRLVELDLSGVKTVSSSQSELKLDFLQCFKKLLILNLSQTSVTKLPDMSTLVSLKDLLLVNCQHLKVVPDLQSLTNLETLDLSLRNASSNSNLPLEFETKGHLSYFPVPNSIRKLVLTNRSGIKNLFPGTLLANMNLELLDLRGTDVVGLDSKLESQPPQERVPRPVEIHMVSVDCESSSQQSEQSPDIYHSDDNEFVKWDALFSDIQMNLNSFMAQEQVERLHNDLRYIQENYDRLKSSSSWKNSNELLQELMDAATNLSRADFVVDSESIMELLRIVVKLKLLVPPKHIDESEALEVTKQQKKKKKKPLFKKSQSQENAVMTEIARGMQGMELDLLSSYKSLSPIQKHCLLCFSIFPYSKDKDKNTGHLKSLVIKKKILIYWWVGEGFIDPHYEENVNLEPSHNQNLNPNPHTSTNTDRNMVMSREIEERREEATEQFFNTKLEQNPITLEEIGKHILNVLAEKGFIEHVMKKGRESGSCCIHPFVHSFVIERAKEECFFDFDRKTGKLASHFTRSQRACLLESRDSMPSSCELWASYINSPNMLKSFKTVKTLFNVNDSMIDIMPEWFSKMKNLSVLHLGSWNSENTDLIELGDQNFMEGLKHMRKLKLLSLQGLPTTMKLPDSVRYLTNLIILDLKECNYLHELPASIGSLKNLTHLDISNCPLLYKLPKEISLLSKLEVLKGFVLTDVVQAVRSSHVSILRRWGLFCCKNSEACTFRDLLKLKKLRELSIVVNISKFPEDDDLLVFREMKKLSKLKIFWERSISSESIEVAIGQETLMGQNIEKLELWCFQYEEAPYWLNPKGLQNLKKLYIVGGNLRKLHGSEANENSWKVKTLQLKFLHKLDVLWSEVESVFPELMYLEKVPYDQNDLFPLNNAGVWRPAS